MRLIENRKPIRLARRKLKTIFFLLKRRKKVMQKWRLLTYLGRFGIMKRNFVKGKRMNIFTQKNLRKKSFIFKRLLELCSVNNTYNVCVFTKSKSEYLALKNSVNFSALTFDFWFITKQMVSKLFKENKYFIQLSKTLNGGLLVVKAKTLQEIVEHFLVFNQQQTFCSGFFLQKRFFWPEDFFGFIAVLERDCSKVSVFVGKAIFKMLSKLLSFCVQLSKLCRQSLLVSSLQIKEN